jgi:hypothetical protein
MVEQPLPPITAGASGDLLDHAKLAKMIKTPVCLDESLCSLAAARLAIELGSATYFNIKPSRCGGVTVALQIMELAHKHGITCWVGGMLESGVGVQVCTYALHTFCDQCAPTSHLRPCSSLLPPTDPPPSVSDGQTHGSTTSSAFAMATASQSLFAQPHPTHTLLRARVCSLPVPAHPTRNFSLAGDVHTRVLAARALPTTQFCQALAGLAPCSYPADLFPSTRFYREDLADEDVVVFTHTRADATTSGGHVLCIRVPNVPHTVAPVPRLLRRCTISKYELWLEEGADGPLFGEADGTGELGRQLQRGTVKL